MLPTLTDFELILRLSIAALLGGLIGFERERLSWVAGLRTHMLVCLGATLIMMVSQYGFHQVITAGYITLDPSRMAAQVVSGIGFLGAGTILFLKNVVRGLTTAASLWAVAAVGLAVGGGLYLAAVFTTALILVILAGIKPLEKKFIKKNKTLGVRFSVRAGSESLNDRLTEINQHYGPSKVQVEKSGGNENFHLFFKPEADISFVDLVNDLRKIEGIESIEVINEAIAT